MYELCTLKCVLHKSFTISFQDFLNFSLFFWTGSAKTFSKKISTWRIYKLIINGLLYYSGSWTRPVTSSCTCTTLTEKYCLLCVQVGTLYLVLNCSVHINIGFFPLKSVKNTPSYTLAVNIILFIIGKFEAHYWI